MIGIYKITNKVNGKCYIGQSTHVEKRWTKHRNTAMNANMKGYFYPLYCSMRKYGLENFSFEILEQCSVEELNEKEIKYIAQYKSNFREYGYNQDEGGTCQRHGKLTYPQVESIKNCLRNTKLSTVEIAEEFGLHPNTILDINSGRTWITESEQYPIRNLALRQYKITESGERRVVYSHEPKRYFCSRCGQEIKTNANYCRNCVHEIQKRAEKPSRLELAKIIVDIGFEATGRKYNVSGKTISKWCQSYNMPYKIKELQDWYYQETGIEPPAPKPVKEKAYTIRSVKQIHPQTKQVIRIFPTATDAVRHLGVGRGDHILEVCKGKRKTACGFLWEYA